MLDDVKSPFGETKNFEHQSMYVLVSSGLWLELTFERLSSSLEFAADKDAEVAAAAAAAAAALYERRDEDLAPAGACWAAFAADLVIWSKLLILCCCCWACR